MEVKITLVLMVGLPGAGKSNLCKKLFHNLKTKPNFSELSLIHICFDELIPLDIQEKFVLTKQNKIVEEGDGTSWKSLRQDVHIKIEQLIEYLKGVTAVPEVCKMFGITRKPDKNEKYAILLDDNFYYRSMRYEYFQLARKHGIGYCQCYIECPKDVAIHQNHSREVQVPTAAIETMANNLQPPQPDEHAWEHNTLVVSTRELEKLNIIWDLIEKGLESPVPPLENRETEIAEARLQCSQSVAHQSDLMLRNLVGVLIKEAKVKQVIPAVKFPEFSRKVNAGRQNILVAIKDGSLKFPAHLAVELCDENKKEINEFLKMELERIIEYE